jgi:hypothetical protein
MFSFIVLQPLELRIPVFLIGLVLGIEIETNFVEHPFSFRFHSAIVEACTLIVDPIAQCRVTLVSRWHIACKAGREIGGALVGYSR